MEKLKEQFDISRNYKIKAVKTKTLSLLQWETVSSEISNAVNYLPLALENIISDYENMDLLTPSRLKLGRNNERSPVSPNSIAGYL